MNGCSRLVGRQPQIINLSSYRWRRKIASTCAPILGLLSRCYACRVGSFAFVFRHRSNILLLPVHVSTNYNQSSTKVLPRLACKLPKLFLPLQLPRRALCFPSPSYLCIILLYIYAHVRRVLSGWQLSGCGFCH